MPSVRYRLTYLDWILFDFYHYVRRPMVWVTFCLLLFFLVRDQMNAAPHQMSAREHVFMLMLATALWSAVIWLCFSLVISVRMLTRLRRSALTEHAIEITPQNVVDQTTDDRIETPWAAIRKLAVTRRHIFLYVGPSQAHVIPRRAFADRPAWRSFVAECRKSYRARTQAA